MKILKLIFIFTALNCFSQKIEWSNQYKLKFEDFTGKIPLSENEEVAGSMISIEYKILSTSIWNGKIKIKIFPTFNKTTSWIKSEFVSEYLLNHEQKHFDIAKIYSDKLQKMVNEKIKSTKDFNENFQKIYDEIYDEYNKFQSTYDLETKHSQNVEKQKEYNSKIAELLENFNSR